MTKFHVRTNTGATLCGRQADLTCDENDFRRRIASDQCQRCKVRLDTSALAPAYMGLIFCRNLQTGAGTGSADPDLFYTSHWRATTVEVEADLTALHSVLTGIQAEPRTLMPFRVSIVQHVWSIDLSARQRVARRNDRKPRTRDREYDDDAIHGLGDYEP